MAKFLKNSHILLFYIAKKVKYWRKNNGGKNYGRFSENLPYLSRHIFITQGIEKLP